MFSTTDNARDARPRFEFYPLDSTKLQTVCIDEFPFIIGRSSSASLQINSTSVSREHAEIAKTPTGFCVRDLNSTNGTTVNGRTVKESPLVDGDSVGIADTELTFLASSLGRLQRTLTKPLPGKKPAATTPGVAAEVAATRCMSEALLLQAIPLEWSQVVDETTNQSPVSMVQIMSPLREWMANADAKQPTTVASRIELLGWHLAVEQLDEQSTSGTLLLSVHQREMLDDRLIDMLKEVSSSILTQQRIGISVHWEWATATPDTLRLFGKLRERGVVIAYDEFSGGGGCIESMDPALPDYLVFSPQVIRGAAEQPRRLQRLEIVQATCDARRIDTVMPGSLSSDDKSACRQVGIHLAQRHNHSHPVNNSLAAALA